MDETDSTRRDRDRNATVACTLDEADRERREDRVRSELLPRYEGAEEREDGWTLAFAGTDETLAAVAAFVRAESECCSFARYRIDVEPPYDRTRLTVTGPDGTRELFRRGLVDRFEDEASAT